MKTLEELTNDLSKWYTFGDNWHDFYIKRNGIFVDLKDSKTDALYVHFRNNGEYKFHSAFLSLPFVYVKDIVEYISSTDEHDWFPPEKKYNIIIGESYGYYKDAYRKLDKGMYAVIATQEDSELMRPYHLFTESEIEELKSTLQENMAKIVDLGKVEVKDEIVKKNNDEKYL